MIKTLRSTRREFRSADTRNVSPHDNLHASHALKKPLCSSASCADSRKHQRGKCSTRRHRAVADSKSSHRTSQSCRKGHGRANRGPVLHHSGGATQSEIERWKFTATYPWVRTTAPVDITLCVVTVSHYSHTSSRNFFASSYHLCGEDNVYDNSVLGENASLMSNGPLLYQCHGKATTLPAIHHPACCVSV